MAYSVYIIFSATLNKFYIGYTEDIETRLQQHNSGISTYTSKATDWHVKHIEAFETRQQAMQREREIKSKKSRKYIESIISNG